MLMTVRGCVCESMVMLVRVCGGKIRRKTGSAGKQRVINVTYTRERCSMIFILSRIHTHTPPHTHSAVNAVTIATYKVQYNSCMPKYSSVCIIYKYSGRNSMMGCVWKPRRWGERARHRGTEREVFEWAIWSSEC